MSYDVESINHFEEIVKMAGGYDNLKYLSGEYKGACPICGEDDRFRVSPNIGLSGKWYCRHCKRKGGSAIDLYKEIYKCDFISACKELGAKRDDDSFARQSNKTGNAKLNTTEFTGERFNPDKPQMQNALQRMRKIKADKAGAIYLEHRGLDSRLFVGNPDIELNEAFMFGKFPALVFRWSDSKGRGAGWFYIDIKSKFEGSKEAKKWIQNSGVSATGATGGAFRLCKPQDVLGICEGVENALSVMLLNGFAGGQAESYLKQYENIPVWAIGSCYQLKQFIPPKKVKKVVVFADPDNAGTSAAEELQVRLHNYNIACEIVKPPKMCGKSVDWNEYLIQLNNDSLSEAS